MRSTIFDRGCYLCLWFVYEVNTSTVLDCYKISIFQAICLIWRVDVEKVPQILIPLLWSTMVKMTIKPPRVNNYYLKLYFQTKIIHGQLGLKIKEFKVLKSNFVNVHQIFFNIIILQVSQDHRQSNCLHPVHELPFATFSQIVC